MGQNGIIMREFTRYNLVIGTDRDGQIYVLDDTFHYSATTKSRVFHGATGTVLEPITQEKIDEAVTTDEKVDYYEELWRADARQPNGTKKGLKRWASQISDDEYLDNRFEPYTTIEASDIAAVLGVDEPARYAITGIGRIFSNGVLDQLTLVDSDEVRDAVAEIRKFEKRDIS